jgi:molecular chaperone DnaK
MSTPNLTKWTLGIAAAGGKYMPLVPKGVPVPLKRTITVTTTTDAQPNMVLDVYLGERPVAADNYLIARVNLTDIESGSKGTSKVKLTFYIYANGIYEVGIRYKEDGDEQKVSIIPSAGLTGEEVEKIKQRICKYAEEMKPQEISASGNPIIPLPAI